MILAIETSTPVCSVAIWKPGGTIIEKRIEGKGVHSERTFTFIEELLERLNISVQDFEAVLFSNGPGSYTGLRIGAAAIKGLLFGREIPLFTLSSLVGFSTPLMGQKAGVIHSVIDARREHLYHQKIEIDASGNVETSDPSIKKITELSAEINEGDVIAGSGWERLVLTNPEKHLRVGLEGISAKNLIIGWNNSSIKPLFKQKDAGSFEPDYLTMAQVNNSAVRQ